MELKRFPAAGLATCRRLWNDDQDLQGRIVTPKLRFPRTGPVASNHPSPLGGPPRPEGRRFPSPSMRWLRHPKISSPPATPMSSPGRSPSNSKRWRPRGTFTGLPS